MSWMWWNCFCRVPKPSEGQNIEFWKPCLSKTQNRRFWPFLGKVGVGKMAITPEREVQSKNPLESEWDKCWGTFSHYWLQNSKFAPDVDCFRWLFLVPLQLFQKELHSVQTTFLQGTSWYIFCLDWWKRSREIHPKPRSPWIKKQTLVKSALRATGFNMVDILIDK